MVAAARRRRRIGRQRRAALAVFAALIAAAAIVALRPGNAVPRAHQAAAPQAPAPGPAIPPPAPGRPAKQVAAVRRVPPFSVGLRVLSLVDRSRRIHLTSGATGPRSLTTYVRFPVSAAGPGGGNPAAAAGPFPLIVFGHGFSVTPAVYARLLQAWARAGYVVAAPTFPLGNANAPGGPDESDLPNQPRDMRFVISALLARSVISGGPLHHLIDPREVAVAGQSDGGDTALALAYNSNFRDSRIRAAAILSGAEIPGQGGFTFPGGSPPLLATQGSADTVNLPALTREFFARAQRPKYLLNLLGASHLPPYTEQQPQLGIVERVTIAFFDLYLKRSTAARRQLFKQGSVPGIATLNSRP